MINHISEVAELLVIYTMAMLITHYVFLEMKQKRQNLFHIVAILCIEGIYLVTGFELAVNALLFFMALNIFLSRKKHRFRGALLCFPIAGIADGLALPIVTLPARLARMGESSETEYQLLIYGVLAVAYIIFLIRGKQWRERFEVELEGRTLLVWEKILLCFIGILLMVLSTVLDMPIRETANGQDAIGYVYLMVVLLGITSFIMTLAMIIVVLVGNKQNFYHGKVSDMQFNIIVMMAEIVENRDKNTGGHIRRTATYVEIIAKQLKKEGKFKEELTDVYVKDMIVAAPLHDIGKIHVSDVILNKNGRLTDEEFAIMKTHAEAGRELLTNAKLHLGNFSYLDIAVDMAGSHHEWWDGSVKGYPDGIKGEEIPLCARIMAVADVFDALISKRCYKEPMPLEKAYAIIREESGTHFDPMVVDAFFAAQDKVEAALAQFREEEEQWGDADMACIQKQG